MSDAKRDAAEEEAARLVTVRELTVGWALSVLGHDLGLDDRPGDLNIEADWIRKDLAAALRAAETRGREAGLNQGLREATGLNVVEIRASVQGVLDWGLKLRGPCSCTYDYTCHHCYEMQQVRGRLVRSLGSPAPAGEEE
jgi:hypothetical protein